MDENHSAPSARTKKLNKERPGSLKTDSFNETVNGIEKHADNGSIGDCNADTLKITFREVSYSISEGFIRRSKYLNYYHSHFTSKVKVAHFFSYLSHSSQRST